MENKMIPAELYDQKSFFSLAGASTAVWLFTNVIGNVVSIDIDHKYKWIGLIIAVFLSFLGVAQIKKINLTQGTIAFFNGLLIFVSASGINAINHGFSESANSEIKSAKILNFIDKNLWWEPSELTAEIIELQEINTSVETYYKSKVVELLDSCNRSTSVLDISKYDSLDYYQSESILKDRQILKLKNTIQGLENILAECQKNPIVKEESSSSKNEKQVLVNYLDDLLKLNRKLLKNLKEYTEAGNFDYPAKMQAYEQANQNVSLLESQIKEYNKKILLLTQNLK